MKNTHDVIRAGANSETTLSGEQRTTIAAQLSECSGLTVYPASVSAAGGCVISLAANGRERRLVAAGELGKLAALPGDRRMVKTSGTDLDLAVLELTHDCARAVRELLPWTGPMPGGLTRSAGLGDRLGLATPGHVAAIRGSGCVPFLAQQSIREMTRTERTPAQVMDDATWGVLQAGWREGFSSDADHLKEPADIDATDAVGFTMFTIDPGDHVRSDADAMDVSALGPAMESVPFAELETTLADLRHAYLGKSFTLEGGERITFDEETLARATIKYSGAIAHTARMFRHLVSRRADRPFELEVSVDETATPTTVGEHYLIAAELKRLGVEWISLAPRFVGEFEKGIDYKGDLGVFEREYARHVAIARTLGPYKLSLHSGSDKFSVYPIAARLSGELVHLKTAGTSYLEALRVAARKAPDLFRRILAFAFERFGEDRASYHISADVAKVPAPDQLGDDQLESVLNGNDGRQLLHVTYGSVLTTKADGAYMFRDELLGMLIDHEDEHYAVLEAHLGKHVQPFAKA